MAYEKQEWRDLPDETTPISASRLNHMEDGIYEAYEHGGGESAPIGGIMMYGGTVAPTGWLICDGSLLNKTDYQQLYTAIGNTYNLETDADETKFRLPDMRKMTPVGASGDGAYSLGATGGEEEVTLTIEEMPAHTHNTLNIAIAAEGSSISVPSTATPTYRAPTSSTGGGQAHNNMQPYVALNFIMKATDVTPNQSNVINERSESTTDTYSCDYINKLNTYSTDEIVIGTWLGKPLYRKVVDFGSLPNNAAKTVNHYISNLDKVINIGGYCFDGGESYYPIPLVYKGADGNYNVQVSVEPSVIRMVSNTNRSQYNAYVILEYTKDTESTE